LMAGCIKLYWIAASALSLPRSSNIESRSTISTLIYKPIITTVHLSYRRPHSRTTMNLSKMEVRPFARADGDLSWRAEDGSGWHQLKKLDKVTRAYPSTFIVDVHYRHSLSRFLLTCASHIIQSRQQRHHHQIHHYRTGRFCRNLLQYGQTKAREI